MLYRKKLTPSCSYCAHGSSISDEEVICLHRGVVSSDGHCRKFSYDPLKREPEHHSLPALKEYKAEDFSLE